MSVLSIIVICIAVCYIASCWRDRVVQKNFNKHFWGDSEDRKLRRKDGQGVDR